jgi:hypothetical protein
MKVQLQAIADYVNQVSPDFYFQEADDIWEHDLRWDEAAKLYRVVEQKAVVLEDTLSGSLCWQGVGADPTEGCGVDVVKDFKKWLSNQTSTSLTFRVPHAKKEQVLAFLATLNIKPL